jgi:hypothetical protein
MIIKNKVTKKEFPVLESDWSNWDAAKKKLFEVVSEEPVKRAPIAKQAPRVPEVVGRIKGNKGSYAPESVEKHGA